VQEKRAKVSDDDALQVIIEGARKANAFAEHTLWQAKAAMGFDFFARKLDVV
jgi:hypothetical protein